jgi:hypothetical protein
MRDSLTLELNSRVYPGSEWPGARFRSASLAAPSRRTCWPGPNGSGFVFDTGGKNSELVSESDTREARRLNMPNRRAASDSEEGQIRWALEEPARNSCVRDGAPSQVRYLRFELEEFGPKLFFHARYWLSAVFTTLSTERPFDAAVCLNTASRDSGKTTVTLGILNLSPSGVLVVNATPTHT